MDSDASQRASHRSSAGLLARRPYPQTLPGETGLSSEQQGQGCHAAGLLEGVQTEEGVPGEAGLPAQTGSGGSQGGHCYVVTLVGKVM